MARAGPQPTRTAGAIIALANQKASSAWAERVRDPTPTAKPRVEENAYGKKEDHPAAEPPAADHMVVDATQESGQCEPEAPAVQASPVPATPRITLRIRSQAATPAAPTPPEPKPATTRSGRLKRAALNGKKAPVNMTTPTKRTKRSRKRKASEGEEESEAEVSGGAEPAPRHNGRRSSPPPPPSGRVLRSRVAKQSLREPSSELSEGSEED